MVLLADRSGGGGVGGTEFTSTDVNGQTVYNTPTGDTTQNPGGSTYVYSPDSNTYSVTNGSTGKTTTINSAGGTGPGPSGNAPGTCPASQFIAGITGGVWQPYTPAPADGTSGWVHAATGLGSNVPSGTQGSELVSANQGPLTAQLYVGNQPWPITADDTCAGIDVYGVPWWVWAVGFIALAIVIGVALA